jgi:hypothetical protein
MNSVMREVSSQSCRRTPGKVPIFGMTLCAKTIRTCLSSLSAEISLPTTPTKMFKKKRPNGVFGGRESMLLPQAYVSWKAVPDDRNTAAGVRIAQRPSTSEELRGMNPRSRGTVKCDEILMTARLSVANPNQLLWEHGTCTSSRAQAHSMLR